MKFLFLTKQNKPTHFQLESMIIQIITQRKDVLKLPPPPNPLLPKNGPLKNAAEERAAVFVAARGYDIIRILIQSKNLFLCKNLSPNVQV